MTELAALEVAYAGARRVLEAYLAAPVEQRGAAIAKLRPRAADFRAVFQPEHAAEAAERGYVALWGNVPIWPVPPEPGIVSVGVPAALSISSRTPELVFDCTTFPPFSTISAI